jgi:hypothetical protein
MLTRMRMLRRDWCPPARCLDSHWALGLNRPRSVPSNRLVRHNGQDARSTHIIRTAHVIHVAPSPTVPTTTSTDQSEATTTLLKLKTP